MVGGSEGSFADGLLFPPYFWAFAADQLTGEELTFNCTSGYGGIFLSIVEIENASPSEPIDTSNINQSSITTGVAQALVVLFVTWDSDPGSMTNWTEGIFTGHGFSRGVASYSYTGDTTASGAVVTNPISGYGSDNNGTTLISIEPV